MEYEGQLGHATPTSFYLWYDIKTMIYKVIANKDQLIRSGLYAPELWQQHFLDSGLAWENKVVQSFESLEIAFVCYNMLHAKQLVASRNWL